MDAEVPVQNKSCQSYFTTAVMKSCQIFHFSLEISKINNCFISNTSGINCHMTGAPTFSFNNGGEENPG